MFLIYWCTNCLPRVYQKFLLNSKQKSDKRLNIMSNILKVKFSNFVKNDKKEQDALYKARLFLLFINPYYLAYRHGILREDFFQIVGWIPQDEAVKVDFQIKHYFHKLAVNRLKIPMFLCKLVNCWFWLAEKLYRIPFLAAYLIITKFVSIAD